MEKNPSKEELREEFYTYVKKDLKAHCLRDDLGDHPEAFDFLWSHIEAKESEISRLTSLLKAADIKLIEGFEQKILELKDIKSDYWKGVREGYISSLYFIKQMNTTETPFDNIELP